MPQSAWLRPNHETTAHKSCLHCIAFATRQQAPCSFGSIVRNYLVLSQHAKDGSVTWSVGIILGKHSQLHTLVSLETLNLFFDAVLLQKCTTVSDNTGLRAAQATLL